MMTLIMSIKNLQKKMKSKKMFKYLTSLHNKYKNNLKTNMQIRMNKTNNI